MKLRRAVSGGMGLAAAVMFTLGSALAQTVIIDSGKLHGAAADGAMIYRGIPYALPPVGALRWRDPQPLPPWSGVREATQAGKDCLTADRQGGVAAAGSQSEDCLVVNVTVPAKPAGTAPLPVMVWIHGGGFVVGGIAGKRYEGLEYAKRGVIVVSVSYRLGRLGFFALPALKAEAPNDVLGNYGLMDQLAALKWVQRNIAAFGGDPKNVTIFGESAGGFSVLAQVASPLTKGLFERAIPQSGGGRYDNNPAIGEIPIAQGETIASAYAKSVNATGDDAAVLAKLRAMPAPELMKSVDMQHIEAASPLYSGPMIDGKFSVGNPVDVFKAGGGQNVALMIGATSDDFGRSDASSKDALWATFGAHAEQAKAAYDPKGTGDMRSLGKEAVSDRIMVEPARRAAQIYAARGLPVYEYRFSYVPAAERATSSGAKHASDVVFAFGALGPRETDPAALALAKAMVGYWSAFGKTGDPNGEGRPEWPKYSAKTDMLMDFTDDGPKAEADPWKARLDVTQVAADQAAK